MEGLIQKIRYQNPENFWTVATLRTDDNKTVTVVGLMPGLAEGMSVRTEGRWENNEQYGRRFKVEHFVEVVPATAEGIARYLASGFVPGIGETFARRIVEAFGTDTLQIIKHYPGRLTEVSGLGEKRAMAIERAFRERHGTQEALIFLMGLGIPRGLALRIFKRYGDETVAAVRRNPYQLAQEVHGVGFVKADQVAKGMGIAHDHPERITAGLIHLMRVARDDGHVRLERGALYARAVELLEVDRAAVEAGLEALLERNQLVPFEAEGAAFIYLRRLYEAEQGVAGRIAALLQRPAGEPATQESVDAAEGFLEITLAPKQREALIQSMAAPMAIITGGPGTGKTTMIRSLLEVSPARKVALAAPTGRAAKRMQEATGKQAQTIHRLLEYKPQEHAFARDEGDPLDAELVIVDEASMIDLPLFYALLRAVPDDAQLILVGDRDQLPPVGPGSPFTDLILSETVPTFALAQVFRQGEGSLIVDAAHAVNSGQRLPEPKAEGGLVDFYFVRRNQPESVREMIEALVYERIPKRFGLDPIREVQVLSPMRAGPIGVEALNEGLQARLNPPKDDEPVIPGAIFRAGDKVMQIRNDYERGVFNGDMGIVHRVTRKELYVEIDERLVSYEREAWNDLSLAYAVTIHKSQGSEYPAVVIPVSTQHYKMLRRNLLYTGITRGKKLVVLVGSDRALGIAINNSTVEARESGLITQLGAALCRV